MSPKSLLTSLLSLLFVVVAAGAVSAEPVVLVSATYGVRLGSGASTSPNAQRFTDNVRIALTTGQTSFGGNSAPGAYQQQTNFSANQLVTSLAFNSYLGQANPGAAFGPAFAGEFGGRLYFTTIIRDTTGAQVNIANGVAVTRTQSPNAPVATIGGTSSFTLNSYSGSALGVSRGADGVFGTADDVIVPNGTGLVDAIVLIQPGIASAADGAAGATDQERLNNRVAEIAAPGLFTLTVNIQYSGAFLGTNTVTVNAPVVGAPVPEPATMILLGTGLAGVGAARRRRRKAGLV